MESTQSSLTSLACIQNWEQCRTNQSSIENSLFTGNSFTLKVGTVSPVFNRLHIYIGKATPENESGGISFYAVPSVCDYQSTIQTEYENYSSEPQKVARTLPDLVNSKLVPVDFKTTPFKYSAQGESPSAQLLIDSVNNWNNESVRASWLNAKFEGGPRYVLAAFDIDVSDFEPSHEHTCFLALKPDAKNPNDYTIDLVVVNTVTGNILNLEENENNVSFRDLARLVPPFGQAKRPSTNEPNFGVYQIANE
ncbi:hypothetical protein U8527_06125 [Kordia algicida OT-1]|uniref:Uncharacterized protein n=1 Tax=Kordia algicida OT-1 TaxID=391587 RepID=A9E1A0_9FLAO|nr:hypothetical protein [Kordia algicida]EDP95601.1 hypothetical protein KAOT1_22156 [Kordia algicida OT-1]